MKRLYEYNKRFEPAKIQEVMDFNPANAQRLKYELDKLTIQYLLNYGIKGSVFPFICLLILLIKICEIVGNFSEAIVDYWEDWKPVQFRYPYMNVTIVSEEKEEK